MRLTRSRAGRLAIAAGICSVVIFSQLPAQTAAPFQPARTGCAMAHCDPRMSDIVRSLPPAASSTTVLHHDAASPGSVTGLGCSANGHVAICANRGKTGDSIIAYAADGSRLWTSQGLLNGWTWTSAPMVNPGGGAIAADSARVVRFGPAGQVIWATRTPLGLPISPIETRGGTIVLATRFGPLSAYNSTDGSPVGTLYIRENPDDTEFFDTANTPCTAGNRIYISAMKRNDPSNTGWLAALDVDPSNTAEPLKVAWHFTFGAPSGASPTCVGNTIYFDGAGLHPGDPVRPQLFAVRDDGSAGTLVWNQPVTSRVLASLAQDPRGGLWVYYEGSGALDRRSNLTGNVIESLDVPALVGDVNPNVPWSALTIAGAATQPVLIVGTRDIQGLTCYVIAIDLVQRALLWKVNINPAYGTDYSHTQFPIVLDGLSKPVIVASGANSGPYFIGEPPAAGERTGTPGPIQ